MKTKISILVLCLVVATTAISQTITRDLTNAYYGIKGKETYQTKKTETFTVKHGAYNANTSIIQPHGGKEIMTVTGAFKDDQPNGAWVYKITRESFETSGNRYITATITLTQNWIDGKPHGNWEYIYYSRYRNGIGSRSLGTFRYGEWSVPNEKYVYVQYDNGNLHGNLNTGKNKQNITMKCTFKNDYLIYQWWAEKNHEYKMGDRGYTTFGIEEFNEYYNRDFVIQYDEAALEVIDLLNSGVEPKSLKIPNLQITKHELQVPYQAFASEWFDRSFDIDGSIDFNNKERRRDLNPHYIVNENDYKRYRGSEGSIKPTLRLPVEEPVVSEGVVEESVQDEVDTEEKYSNESAMKTRSILKDRVNKATGDLINGKRLF